MPLEQEVREIQTALRDGRFQNEAMVSQGIVLPLLNVLGWPVFDIQIVRPEYPVEGRRVDFALCLPPKREPSIFIEVKQVGQSEGGDLQLFEYAYHAGVPMVVLTDGQRWQFYWPAGHGHYQERRIYYLDLLERSIDESVFRLDRYLSYNNVRTGESLRSFQEDYDNAARQRDILANLPTAWRNLIAQPDSLLIDLITEEVEHLCGYRPDIESVATFLTSQPQSTLPNVPPLQPGTNVRLPERPMQSVSGPTNRSLGFVLLGEEFQARTAVQVLIDVLKKLASRDPNFLERFAARPRHARSRRFVARSQEELYPGRPDLCRDHSYQLSPGWWVGTNYGKRQIAQILEMGCEVAGLRFGFDLVVHLD